MMYQPVQLKRGKIINSWEQPHSSHDKLGKEKHQLASPSLNTSIPSSPKQEASSSGDACVLLCTIAPAADQAQN